MNRREILRGALAAVAAPAVVRAELIMPVRGFVEPGPWELCVLGRSYVISNEEMRKIANEFLRHNAAARRYPESTA